MEKAIVAPKKSINSAGFTLVELLVVIAIIGVLVALLLPAVQAAREAARRTQCLTNLKNVALAMNNYESSKRKFPATLTFYPKGESPNPLKNASLYKNWAIEILPFMEQQALFNSFVINDTTRLSDSVNAVGRSTPLSVMICPSDPNSQQIFSGVEGEWARGNYGLNAMQWWPSQFEWKSIESTPDFDFNIGMGGFSNQVLDQSLRIAQISDGTSSTVMLAEMRAGLSQRDRRGVWAMGMCGSNFHCRHAGYQPNSCVGSEDDVMGNKFIIEDVGEGTARAECMLPQAGLEESGQSVVRSAHPGGAHCAMVDGSARIISDFVQAGAITIGGRISSASGDTDESKFLAWQRMNVSRDSLPIGSVE